MMSFPASGQTWGGLARPLAANVSMSSRSRGRILSSVVLDRFPRIRRLGAGRRLRARSRRGYAHGQGWKPRNYSERNSYPLMDRITLRSIGCVANDIRSQL